MAHAATKPRLTYFNGRGLGEISRLMLAEAGVDFEDRRLEDIKALKEAGGLPFGQVPLYEDGSFVLSQSNAISRYIARKHNFAGANPEQGAIAESVVEALNGDVRPAFRAISDNNLSDEKKAEAKTKFQNDILPRFTNHFEALIKKNGGQYSAGAFTFADVYLYYWYSTLLKDNQDALKNAPLLAALVERVANRPGIAAWVKKRPVSEW